MTEFYGGIEAGGYSESARDDFRTGMAKRAALLRGKARYAEQEISVEAKSIGRHCATAARISRLNEFAASGVVMPSRREFLQAGLAVSIVPVAVPARASSGGLTHRVARSEQILQASHHRLYCVVCDVRSPSSAALGREAERLGFKVVRTTGDITDFWFTDLSLRWKDGPVAVAGLTGMGPLFCLERFGWDHGMRVVFRGTHRLLRADTIEHAIAGPPSSIAAARDAAALDGADWACGVARVLGACESAARERASMTVVGARSGDEPIDVDDTLVSWVIAPKAP